VVVVETLVTFVIRNFITFIDHVNICFGFVLVTYFFIVVSLLVCLDITNDIDVSSVDIL
jgi:hypothetical protein